MHLRTFLKVYGPDLTPLYFRYYDPRVLRTYLPTCNEQEMRTVFGPVLRYIVEDEDHDRLVEVLVRGRTDQKRAGSTGLIRRGIMNACSSYLTARGIDPCPQPPV